MGENQDFQQRLQGMADDAASRSRLSSAATSAGEPGGAGLRRSRALL